jgi:hypothetical protein
LPTGLGSPPTNIGRQQGVECLAHERGHRRRLATGRDGDRDPVPAHHAAQKRCRVGWIIHSVDEDMALFGSRGDLAIGHGCCRGNHEPRTVEIVRAKGATSDRDAGRFNLWMHLRRNDSYASASIHELAELRRCHTSAADEQYVSPS